MSRSASKGLHSETLEMMSDVIPAALERAQPMAFISGPSFAKEILLQMPTGFSIASSGILFGLGSWFLFQKANKKEEGRKKEEKEKIKMKGKEQGSNWRHSFHWWRLKGKGEKTLFNLPVLPPHGLPIAILLLFLCDILAHYFLLNSHFSRGLFTLSFFQEKPSSSS